MTDIQQLEERAAELVPRVRVGDAAAREDLLARCHPTVYRWANVLTADSDDAADVTQEVLIRVAMQLHRFAGRSRFTTWLYQVTRNTAVSFRRRLASRLRLLGGAAEAAEQRQEDPLSHAETSQVGALLEALFRELPTRQREVLYLMDVEGYDAGEIAERLGLRRTTVRAHLFRARHALRARIRERHPDIAKEYGR